MRLLNSLSGRFLILTIIFVMLAEVMIFVPSVARFREDYLLARLERAQIASLALLADDMLDAELEAELLENAEVFNVVLRRDEARQLMLSAPMPRQVAQSFDLRDAAAPRLIMDALARLMQADPEVIRVIGAPVREAGLLIEVTMDSAPLRAAMIEYGVRILVLSAVISVITALMLFLAVRRLFVRPITSVTGTMNRYAAAPEDARSVIQPSSRVTELRAAEEALQQLQQELTQALRQKDRLAQLGTAVSKISHDLRNILTTAQLFTDRIENSEDPVVRRTAPKLVNSMRRAVHLCESTLAFGKAEEPSPQLCRFDLSASVADLVEAEGLAADPGAVSLVNAVPPGLMISADPEQIYRVILNLVRNARQAIAGTGAPGEVRIYAQEEAEAWILWVRDTGPGLSDRAKAALFTPFQGGARAGGTGLGLVIAAELARGHGGVLELHETGQEGTVFRITLPRGGSLGFA